jgi:hypothetical protein
MEWGHEHLYLEHSCDGIVAVRSLAIASNSIIETPYGTGGLLALVRPLTDMLIEVLLQTLRVSTT